MEEVCSWANIEVGSVEANIPEFDRGDANALAAGEELKSEEDNDDK